MHATIAVTGASGQLGTQVLHRLLQHLEVKQVVAIDQRPPLLEHPKLRFVQGDVRDPKLSFENCSAVVHLAFIVTTKVPADLFESVNIVGSQNVFETAIRAGATQIVYASSVAAYGVVAGHPQPLEESSPRVFQPDFPYAAAKYRVEEFLDGLSSKHPAVTITRLRPGILIGTGIQNPLASAFARALDRGWLVAGNDSLQPYVWDEDVADAIVLALQQRRGGAFNLVADEPLTPAALAKSVGLKVVRPPRFLFPLGQLWSRLRGEAQVDPSWLRVAEVSLVASNQKAKRELGWAPSCPRTVDVFTTYRQRTKK